VLETQLFDFLATSADNAARLALMHQQPELGRLLFSIAKFLILFLNENSK
jgi:hypothetical protein